MSTPPLCFTSAACPRALCGAGTVAGKAVATAKALLLANSCCVLLLPTLAKQPCSRLPHPLPWLVPNPAGEDALCRKCLTFAAIGLGCVLPFLLSAFHTERLVCQQQWRANDASTSAQPQQYSSMLWRLLQRAGAAVRAADGGIGRALSARPFWLQRPLLIWWALGYAWEVSKALAGSGAAGQR